MSLRKLYLAAGLAASCLAVTLIGVGSAGAGAKIPPNLTCDGTYNSSSFNNVFVPSGAVCRMNSDSVIGHIVIDGQIYASSLNVGEYVLSDGGKIVQIDTSTITGNFIVQHVKNGPSNQDTLSIVDDNIYGSLVTYKNKSTATGDELISTNTVHGSELDVHNKVSGDLAITAEIVLGDMIVYKNKGGGTKEVDGNNVTGTLECLKNKPPFEASGNTAGNHIGDC
jgi:hypothetical protein